MALSDDTDKQVLAAIISFEDKFDRQTQVTEERFIRVEEELADHREKFAVHDAEHAETRERLNSHNTMLREQAQAITTVASSTARAVEHALDAKKSADQSRDETRVIVESAMRMHSASIADTVSQAVRLAVQPLVAKTDAQEKVNTELKDSNIEQKASLAKQDTKLEEIFAMVKNIANLLGSKKLRIFLLVCAAVGAFVTGGVTTYYAKQGADAHVTPTLEK